ncbi:MAG: TonB-dependent receptor [Prevotella sp.]|nr:TonB-dependent receptor [Prevotella sp.]
MSSKLKSLIRLGGNVRRIVLLAVLVLGGTLLADAQTKVTVVDATGEAVIGASVIEKGTRNGGVTDLDGNFTITVKSDNPVVISYIGMKSQTVSVKGKSTLTVVLEDDNTTLQDVVVVGYGTMKKTDLTGSVSSVNTEQLNAKGAPSVMENLQGATPGVNITQSSGRAGGDFNIEIRGKSSINSDTKPLYVVDGVMCSDIQWLNPQDIEKIDILKDASSTAIYGSRATAGVVMVTTKGGLVIKRDQKPTISYDGYYGLTKTTRMPDFVDGQEFYNYRFLKFLTNAGAKGGAFPEANPTYQIGGSILEQCLLREGIGEGEYVMKKMLASGNTYDWPDLVTRDGNQQNHYLAVNGGSESVNYHFGVGYNKEKGIYLGDSQTKISFKGSVDAKINKIISAGFTFNVANINHDYGNDDAIKVAFRMNPYMIPYDKDGNINHKPGAYTSLGSSPSYQFSDQLNALDLLKNTSKNRETWRALGNFYVKFDLMKGLDFKTTISPSYSSYRQGYFAGYINPATGLTYSDGDENSVTLNQQNSFSWTWDNIINYNTTIAKDHTIGLMALYSMQASRTENSAWAASKVMENTDWWNLKSGDFNADSSSNSYSENSMTSYALRANYGWKSRYLLTATVRWDGSSKLSKDERWGCFPSVAAAWRITEESFMQKYDWISNLKLRLSYGVTGNNTGIGNYDTQQVTSGPIYYPIDGSWAKGFYPSGIVNKVLKWETSKEVNLGLDFGFLRGRISGSIDVYQKTSKDLLFDVKLPLVSGGGDLTTNVGSVRNRGVELSLTTVNIENKDWHWQTTINFSHNQNKVREINGLDTQLLSGKNTGNFFLGYSATNVWGYEWGGIVSDKMMTVPDHAIAKAKGFTPGQQVREYDYYYACYGLTEGQPWVVDRNGDGVIKPDDDRIICNSNPAWTGSFTSFLSWKNIDFSFSLYSKQNYKVFSDFLNGDILAMNDRGRNKLAMDWYIPAGTLIDVDGVNPDGTYINPKYQETTHYGDYPFPNNGGSNAGVGAHKGYWDEAKAIVDASYVKVKNITLGYTFPKSIIKKFGCNHLRLYATVTNPFVFTSYKGFDPEWADAQAKNDGPSTVTYQFGASIKF